MNRRYMIVIERAPGNFSAYAPDVPGCITTGPTVESTVANMVEALTGHLAVMAEYGDAIPEARTTLRDVRLHTPDDLVTTVDVAVPQALTALA
jgi:predicted RNase H-like HicB family nuclease